jgi:leishmanolysin
LKVKSHHQHALREEEPGHFCDHGHFIKTIEIEEPERPVEILIEATLAHEKKLIKNHKQGNWDTIRIKTDYSSFRVI